MQLAASSAMYDWTTRDAGSLNWRELGASGVMSTIDGQKSLF